VATGIIQPTIHNLAPTEATDTSIPDLTTNDQHPEPALQGQAQGTLGSSTEGVAEDGRPSEHAPPPGNDSRQQEVRIEGPTTANTATAPAQPEPEQNANPQVHHGEEAATVPPQQEIGGEDGLTPADKLLETVYGDHI